jgi:hypothetical protein
VTLDLADREIRTERLLLRRYRESDLDRHEEGDDCVVLAVLATEWRKPDP